MLRHMRTTVRLDPQLMAAVKRYAFESGKTVTRVLEEALTEKLARARAPAVRKRISLPVFKGTGLRDGVDLNDARALRDIMDGLA